MYHEFLRKNFCLATLIKKYISFVVKVIEKIKNKFVFIMNNIFILFLQKKKCKIESQLLGQKNYIYLVIQGLCF